MSKLYAGEVAVKATEEAIQILGGAGYVKEHPVEQWHRDSKIYTIFEGTSRDPAAWSSPAASPACTFPDRHQSKALGPDAVLDPLPRLLQSRDPRALEHLQ